MTSSPPALLDGYQEYFGVKKGGVDLRAAILQLPLDQLENFREAVAARRSGGPKEGGRIIFMGNGGSFDNARQMAQCCRNHGIAAKTPGSMDDYLLTAAKHGYSEIFWHGLVQDRLTPNDVVVGISGSGNSENIIKALAYAKEHQAEIFCMGGRDGGKMRPLCGDNRSMIARNQCMEAIEDLHMIMLVLALDALEFRRTLPASLQQFLTHFDQFTTSDNLPQLAAIGAAMIHTLHEHGHTFILGTGIGANHWRADMGRGATNTLPIRGLSAPEVFTMNSAQATANDDGLDFILADGLVKFNPNEKDCAILCELPGSEAMLRHCREILDAAPGQKQIKTFTVGNPQGVNLQMFESYDPEFAVAMLGHSCGQVIREQLLREWHARPLDIPATSDGVKKLGMAQTNALENKLRKEKVLYADELLTFCYGRLYAVKPPAGYQRERCYF